MMKTFMYTYTENHQRGRKTWCSQPPSNLPNPHNLESWTRYDVLIDANLKPWLVEVNASPSLAGTTGSDLAMKTGVINDLLNIVFPEV
jgi:hypothetical protein